jgi:hypothetical protein
MPNVDNAPYHHHILQYHHPNINIIFTHKHENTLCKILGFGCGAVVGFAFVGCCAVLVGWTVVNYQSTMRNIPEDRRPRLHCSTNEPRNSLLPSRLIINDKLLKI